MECFLLKSPETIIDVVAIAKLTRRFLFLFFLVSSAGDPVHGRGRAEPDGAGDAVAAARQVDPAGARRLGLSDVPRLLRHQRPARRPLHHGQLLPGAALSFPFVYFPFINRRYFRFLGLAMKKEREKKK